MRLSKFSDMTDYMSQPSETDLALHRAEAEIARLRLTIKRLEGALCCAAKVLRPYADKADSAGLV
jgi:hypothetical protein